MPKESVQYFDRYSKTMKTEKIYGEAYLRFVYENPLGRLAFLNLVKRGFFSRLYGWLMDRSSSKKKIASFLETYQVDSSEFLEDSATYKTFNEFFYRKLKPEARPIHPDPLACVFPADGRHLGFQDLSQTTGFFVKGEIFSLQELLQDLSLAERYSQGSMVVSRLCPTDYHRFHFPVEGIPSPPIPIQGDLFSVSPIALRDNIHIFTRNKRVLTSVESPTFGRVTMIEVGATMVGGIHYTYEAGQEIPKGHEKGYFRFGGSSTITLFEPGRVQLAPDLIECSLKHVELYAKMGDVLGGVSQTS